VAHTNTVGYQGQSCWKIKEVKYTLVINTCNKCGALKNACYEFAGDSLPHDSIYTSHVNWMDQSLQMAWLGWCLGLVPEKIEGSAFSKERLRIVNAALSRGPLEISGSKTLHARKEKLCTKIFVKRKVH